MERATELERATLGPEIKNVNALEKNLSLF